MYATCPKCQHARPAGDRSPADRCPACGVVFKKWLRQQLAQGDPRPPMQQNPRKSRTSLWTFALAAILAVPGPVTPAGLIGRAVTLLGLSVWGIYFIFTDWSVERGPFREIGESFMHNINLVFHEAGHILFIPFGDFMTTLGGSLMQLIAPAAVLGTFLIKHRNGFAASVGLWWFAQSCMDLAPYIGDARSGELLLLGGVTGAHAPGYHDWTNILTQVGYLELDRALATFVDTGGEALMWLAIVWGSANLYHQFGYHQSGIRTP